MLPTILLTPDIDVDIIITGYEQRFPLRFYCYCSNIDCQVELWTNIPTAVEKEWKGVPFSEIADQPQHYQLDLDILHVPPGVYEFTLRFIVPTAEQEQQSSIMPQWVWYGKPGQNGILRILPCPTANIFESPILYTTLPELKLVNAFEKTERRGTNSDDLLLVLHHFRAQSSSSCIPLHQMNHPLHSYVAFIRKGSTWLTPVAGMHHFHDRNPQEKWQCLLYQDLKEGKIHLWMAVSQNSDCWLSPATTTTSNMTIAATGLNLHCPSGKVAHLLIVSSYASPTAISTTTFKAHNSVCQQLFQLAVSYYEQCIKKQSKGNGSKKECQLTLVDKFEPFVAKQDSFHVDKLGFCTWNAFKKEVSMEKIEAALTSFEQQQIPIQYLLIDDGWQSTSPSGQMLSFDTFHCRFGDTLQNAITNLKRNHPLIQHIGVWHTLAGYWYGMDESFAKNSGYSWTFSTHQQDSRSVGLVTDPHQFYEDFYKFLKSAGVDFVKVDNQGGFQDLRIRAEADNMSVWDAYRKAMVQNADRYLNGQVIHCMALTPHILFDLYTHKKTRLSFRNSDDFFPDVADSHAWHIYANAINSLLTSQYPDIISDWDMFQSDHPFAEFHATARAISGGPIYITDVPLKHNKQLIMKLVAQTRQSTYSILRFSTPPQPSFDTVFGNPMGRLSILSLYNKHCEDKENNAEDKAPNCICSSNATVMEYGACGFWNPKSQEQLGAVSSSAIFGVGKNIGLAYHVARIITGPEQGKLWLLRQYAQHDLKSTEILDSRSVRNDNTPQALSVRVKGYCSTLISFSPVRTIGCLGIACLGLMDKLNGLKAVKQTDLKMKRLNDDLSKEVRAFSVRKPNDNQPISIEFDHSYTYRARLTHRSSSCGFWLKSMPINEIENNNVTALQRTNFYPYQVRLDGQILMEDKDWIWSSETGLLNVNMMATPLNLTMTDTFLIDIEIHPVKYK